MVVSAGAPFATPVCIHAGYPAFSPRMRFLPPPAAYP